MDRQMELAHVYYNDLVALERARRAAARATLVEMCAPALRAQLEEYARLSAASEAAWQVWHASGSEAAAEAARQASNTAKAAWAALKSARLAAFREPAIAAAMREIDARWYEMQRAARARCGVYWGTYLLVEDAIDRARGDAHADIRFRRWGERPDAVGVQLQGGLDTAGVLGGKDRRLQFDAASWDGPRRARGRTRVRLRIGSAGPSGRDPVWAELPMTMHRPLPPGQIKEARIIRTKVGSRYRYDLVVTVNEVDSSLPPGPPGTPATGTPKESASAATGAKTVDAGMAVGAIAIDVGWRVMPDRSLRVAAWADSTGATGTLALPTALDELRQVEGLRRTRDKLTNEHRAALRALVGTDTYALREAWWKKDRHLHDWEDNQRKQILDKRLDDYRVFAARVAKIYATVTVEELDLRDFAVEKPDDPAWAHALRHARALAAPSILLDCLKQACAKRGTTFIEADPAHTTTDCSWCGSREEWDAATELEHTCSACGLRWDQDVNAAHNLLTRERPSGEEAEVGRSKKRVRGNRKRSRPADVGSGRQDAGHEEPLARDE